MGRIWGAANREEGYKLGAEAGWFVIGVDLIAWSCRGIYRYFSGRPLFGDRHRKTDATFLRPGTRQLRANDRPPFAWSWLPEWKRAAIRMGILILAITIPWAYWGSGPSSLISAFISVFIIGNVVYALFGKAARKLANTRHNREVVAPMQAGLAKIIGIKPNEVRVRIPKQKRGRAS